MRDLQDKLHQPSHDEYKEVGGMEAFDKDGKATLAVCLISNLASAAAAELDHFRENAVGARKT